MVDPEKKVIRIAIIDDNSFIRNVLRKILSTSKNPLFKLVFELDTLAELKELEINDSPDLILLDIDMPGLNGCDGIPVVQKYFPDSRVVMFTDHEEASIVLKCARMGAKGYLKKRTSAKDLILILDYIFHDGIYIGHSSGDMF